MMDEEVRGVWNDLVPRIEPECCRRCPDCPPVAGCLAQAFRRDGDGNVPYADGERCFACYLCVLSCPYEAIVVPRMR
jgi:Fe-S-cluster-containing hydrogenase component 2